jgi:hypothetical protein
MHSITKIISDHILNVDHTLNKCDYQSDLSNLKMINSQNKLNLKRTVMYNIVKLALKLLFQ